MSWSHLDNQMRKFAPFFRDEFGITPPESNAIVSTIAAEISGIPDDWRQTFIHDAVPPKLRLQELEAFQTFMDIVSSQVAHPAVVRAQVVYQNYVCFVYLSDSCFKQIRKLAPPGSVTKKCCHF